MVDNNIERNQAPPQQKLEYTLMKALSGLFFYPTYDILEGTRGKKRNGNYTVPMEWMN